MVVEFIFSAKPSLTTKHVKLFSNETSCREFVNNTKILIDFK
uniref:Uncharacterized protein n=1 Tax=Manihot esculenta TaxID=3983 RepID=A0A2C9WFF4_MANES